MHENSVIVFGGTGFLGQKVVSALAEAGHNVRVAARNPDRVTFAGLEHRIERHAVDVRDALAVADALAGMQAAINAVSLYREKGELTFEAIHVRAAARIARYAREIGVQQLVHISGIGVDPTSRSTYVAARARGEAGVHAACPGAIILRPSVMFGRNDALISAADRVTRLPVVPLFGRGRTRLQPVYVGDVAAAIAAVLHDPPREHILELGGGAVYRYREILEAVMRARRRHHLLIPVPFALWRVGTALLAVLPDPPLTRDQVIMLQHDNVATPGSPGFGQLGIQPVTLEATLSYCLKPY